MPPLTRWFVKTAFVYLVLAMIVGLLLAIPSVLQRISGLFPVYIHLLVFGWLTQLVFGVVFWMFPKYSQEKPRGSEALGWWTYGLLNAGLILRGVAEPMQSVQPNLPGGWLLVISALAQFLAGVTFVVNAWGRVKER